MAINWFKYSSPASFYPVAGKLVPLFFVLALLFLIPGLYISFFLAPTDAQQGEAYRIIFIHVPAAINAQIFFTVSLVTSILFLVKKNFLWDSISVSCIEVGTMLVLVNLVTGSIWGRNQWGIWWAWDLRMTSQLMCFLLYLGYLLVRPAIAEIGRAHV